MDKVRSEHLKGVETSLKQRLAELLKGLRAHDAQTSQALPENSTEAAPVVRELHVIEAQERMESAEVGRIRAALLRIQEGKYGLCVQCGGKIPEERLRALPAAERCVPCAERTEHK